MRDVTKMTTKELKDELELSLRSWAKLMCLWALLKEKRMIGELTIIKREGQTYALLRCQWCPVQIECPVNMEHIEAWRQGAMIQDAMPELSADLREMFISGTCPKCWDDMFGEFDQ
jgi:hypothetical protein